MSYDENVVCGAGALFGGLVIRYTEISQQPRESGQCAQALQIAGVAVTLIRQHDVAINKRR
jgi:hypothetical protein